MLRNSVINKVIIKELQYYEVKVEQSRLYSTVTQLGAGAIPERHRFIVSLHRSAPLPPGMVSPCFFLR